MKALCRTSTSENGGGRMEARCPECGEVVWIGRDALYRIEAANWIGSCAFCDGHFAIDEDRYVKATLRPLTEEEREEAKIVMGKSPREYFEACDTRAAFDYSPAGEPENPWGDVIFSRDFRGIERIIDDMLAQSDLPASLEKFAEKVYKRMKAEKGVMAEMMPSKEICSKCGVSHEGNELVKAILLYVATKVVDSKRKDILKAQGMAE